MLSNRTIHWVGLDADDVQRTGVCTMDDLLVLLWPPDVERIMVIDDDGYEIIAGIGVTYDPSSPIPEDGVAIPEDWAQRAWRRASKLMEAAIYSTVYGPWAAPLFANMTGHETKGCSDECG